MHRTRAQMRQPKSQTKKRDKGKNCPAGPSRRRSRTGPDNRYLPGAENRLGASQCRIDLSRIDIHGSVHPAATLPEMAAPFELVRVDDGRFVTSGIHRGKRSDLGGGLAPPFNFNVLFQFVGRVSVAVESHETP